MNVKGFTQLEPISKKDRIVALIKEAILSGRMASGDPIVENRVAQQLGVGQPLVREALIELEHQGFVQRMPYRGTRVTKLSREDIIQIFRLRIEWESLALEWAKENVGPGDLAGLQKLIKEMRQCAKEMDLTRFYEHDLAFHRKLWELSGNKYLAEALERVVAPLFAFFLVKTVRRRESYVESVAMHKRIVDGLSSMSAADLRQLMQESLGRFKKEWLTKLLPEGEEEKS